MFQTEIILFLQSFSSDFLNSFFNLISDITYHAWIMPLMLLIMFGINWRAGYILVHVVLWNGLITGYFKNYLKLPRPNDVDSSVKRLDTGAPNESPFIHQGAKGFFGGLPKDVVEYYRLNPVDTYGFPSGHTSRAMATWGSIFLYFKRGWVRAVSVFFVIFIPLSRMYLGRHFLIDILGGYLIGLIILLAFYLLVFRNDVISSYVFEKSGRTEFDRRYILLLTYFLVVPCILPFLPNTNLNYSASLLGVSLGFVLLRIRGIPSDEGNLVQRIARVIIAGIFYFGVDSVLEKGTGLLFAGEPQPVAFLRRTLSMLLLVWISTEISIKLGFFKRLRPT